MSTRKVSPHTGRDEEEDDPYVTQLGCRVEYEALEECLADHDRDWTKCQAVVAALRACHTRNQKAAEAGT